MNEEVAVNPSGPIDRTRLVAVVCSRAIFFFVLVGLMFFLPAGTTAYWQAWVYLAVVFLPVSYTIVYLLKNDPELLERRIRGREKVRAQKTIQRFSLVGFVATFLLPGFDRRFGWSEVPLELVLAADGIVLVGYFVFILVIRENRYASRIIEVQPGQTVVTTGPYSLVRHPMYSGVLLLYAATPLALGSFWALVGVPLIVLPLIARILNEEKVLNERLPGYREYAHRTRYRLIPGIW